MAATSSCRTRPRPSGPPRTLLRGHAARSLPGDPAAGAEEGFIVVYEFPDPTAAAEAAAAQAAYLATGPAKVQSASGRGTIIRLVGQTVMSTWLPSAVEDPLQPGIQAALEMLGTGVPVPC